MRRERENSGGSTNGLRVLSGIAVLNDIPADDLARLCRECRWHFVVPGTEIIGAETRTADVFFVVEGCVRVTIYARGGKEVSFRDLDSGASFGELAAIDGAERSASVVAREDTTLASLTRDQFLRLLREQHSVTLHVLSTCVGIIRDLTDRIVSESTLTVRGRVCRELIRLAVKAGVSDNRALLSRFPTHADLASGIGAAREPVTRELGRLTRAGLIAKEGQSLLVVDVDALVELSEN